MSPTADLLGDVVPSSGIGPLMFLVFVNKLDEILDRAVVKVKLFADNIQLLSCLVVLYYIYSLLSHAGCIDASMG